MRPRQLPVTWLFTDPRAGDPLQAAARLPRGSGIVLRHHQLPAAERAVLWQRLARLAARRGLLLLDAHDPLIGKAHDRRELVAARRSGAALVFVSPVFATRTHPGAPALGPVRFGLLVRGCGVPVAALGGMNARRFRRLRPLGAVAWGGIDAFLDERRARS